MRVCLLSEAPVNRTHGTGCLLLRLLADGGADVCNIHPAAGPGAAASALPSFQAERRPRPGANFFRRVDALSRRVFGRSVVPVSAKLDCFRLEPGAAEALIAADIIVAVVYSVDGLSFVRDALKDIASPAPLLLWFLDCEIGDMRVPSDIDGFLRRRTTEVWACNECIRQTIAAALPWTDLVSSVKFHLGVELPHDWRRESAAGDCIMIGNFWNVRLAPLLGRAWSLLRGRDPSCGPLSWHGAAEAPARLERQNASAGPDIVYRGYAPKLDPVLGHARAALVPFSTACHRGAYSQHSFPSRIADYCAHGLPVFALADNDSLASKFILKHGIGVACDSDDPAVLAGALHEFLADDVSLREQSVRAREAAERLFDINQVRPAFIRDLESLAQGKPEAQPAHF